MFKSASPGEIEKAWISLGAGLTLPHLQTPWHVWFPWVSVHTDAWFLSFFWGEPQAPTFSDACASQAAVTTDEDGVGTLVLGTCWDIEIDPNLGFEDVGIWMYQKGEWCDLGSAAPASILDGFRQFSIICWWDKLKGKPGVSCFSLRGGDGERDFDGRNRYQWPPGLLP